jgi:hypothetical protein
MNRHYLSLIILGALCLGLGAQSPRSLTPRERHDLYKRNKAVIEQLVEKSVESSNIPTDHLKRADTYYKVLYQFNLEIDQARKSNDQARAKELSMHLATLLDQGLKPTLEQAHLQLKGGTGAAEFPKIKEQLLVQFDALLGTLPEDDTTQQSLSAVRSRLLNVGDK